MLAMFKYKDKQQLLWGTGQNLATDFLVYTDKI